MSYFRAKLIAFHMNEAKEKELPTLVELMEKPQGGETVSVDELRLAGLPMAQRKIEIALERKEVKAMVIDYQTKRIQTERGKRRPSGIFWGSLAVMLNIKDRRMRRQSLKCAKLLIRMGATTNDIIQLIRFVKKVRYETCPLRKNYMGAADHDWEPIELKDSKIPISYHKVKISPGKTRHYVSSNATIPNFQIDLWEE